MYFNQRHNNDFFLLFLQSIRNFLCGHSCVQKPERKLRQNTRSHRCACAVHHTDVFIIRRRDHGVLIRAGKLRREGDDNGGFSLLFCLFKLFDKVARGRLTGGGHHIAFDELLVECSVVNGYAVEAILFFDSLKAL